jgi:hypothetical protein
MKKLIPVLLLALLLVACGRSEPDESRGITLEESMALEQACSEANGKFLAEHNECEDISEEACKEMEGTFDECASSCRHEPADAVCVMVCVPLCSFEAAAP